MQISAKIDELIGNLIELKPKLSDDTKKNQEAFGTVLQTSLDTLSSNIDLQNNEQNKNSEIPSWVDPEYGYDPRNPRKPNMREMIEALSGQSVEMLYSKSDADWKKYSNDSSEILYGVVASTEDTRNWDMIMKAENIIKAAREETGLLHKPVVEIASEFDSTNKLVKQYPVIKNEEGEILRSLQGDVAIVENSLQNFGVTETSIPKNIDAKIDKNIFDTDLLTMLKNYSTQIEYHASAIETQNLEKIAMQTTLDAFASHIPNTIPLEELQKL